MVVDSVLACLVVTGAATVVLSVGVLPRSRSPTCELRAGGAPALSVDAGAATEACAPVPPGVFAAGAVTCWPEALSSGLGVGRGPNFDKKNWLAAMAMNVSAKT